MRPVFITHSGLWCAVGGTPKVVRDTLLQGQTAMGRLMILQQTFPYGFATEPSKPFHARLEEGLHAVACDLDLGTLSEDAPLLLGSSSLMIGSVEEGSWPPKQLLPTDSLDESIRSYWGITNRGWSFSCACTSAVHALDAAVGLIETGAVEEALVIGVEICNRITPAGFAALQLLSPSTARPLDLERNGLVLGEAIAAVRLSAQPSGWRIHPPALALDATSATGHASDGSTVAAVMRQALEYAATDPKELRAIKLQASGSPSADAVEARALKTVFGTNLPPLFSLKASLGHTLGASGLAEMVAMLQCGGHDFLPTTAGFDLADSELGVAPNRAPIAWKSGPVLLNIQGFGGGLASWVVERQ